MPRGLPKHPVRIGSRIAAAHPHKDGRVLLVRKGDTATVVRDRRLDELQVKEGSVVDIYADCCKIKGVKMVEKTNKVRGKVEHFSEEALIKLRDVRLVHPGTGQPTNVYLSDERDKYGNFLRKTCGDHTVVPWPIDFGVYGQPATLGSHNTKLELSEAITYQPSIDKPPLPEGVIDEFVHERKWLKRRNLKRIARYNSVFEEMFRRSAELEHAKALQLAEDRELYMEGQRKVLDMVKAWTGDAIGPAGGAPEKAKELEAH